ncbi:MAG: DUF945 family protein, partial [Bradyrhizobium sp.]|nr:DUF945 family protein [Bradyrhizobium sp.]
PELYQQALTQTFFSALPMMLKGSPSLTISPLSWRNAKGETTLNLSILLKDPSLTTTPPQTLADEVDRSVKSLDGKLVIPVDMATAFMTQIAGLEGYQPADAAKLADQQVKGLAAMGQMFRITTMEDNAISSSLQYANGQVTLNGQKMPLEDFAAMFGLEAPAQPDAAPQEGQPQQDDAAPQQDDAAPQPIALTSISGQLTEAEIRVARLAGKGMGYKEIARDLRRSVHTVDHQLRSIRTKLGVPSHAKLVQLLSRELRLPALAPTVSS